MTGAAAFDRAESLRRLAEETFDVLVVGGGVTGAGVALDAAARGLKVALVERGDFASGTSSKSSKLVHGGLRYLQQKEYRLVYENLHERQRLLENAPHLVRPLPFLIPLFGKSGAVNKTVAKAYRTALWLYDITGGLRIGKRHKRVAKDEALRHLPTLNTDLLAAAFLYYDARADDARLTLTILRTAADRGAVIANHAPVAAVTTGPDGRVDGATLADGTHVRAAMVVNATGVWVDDVREMAEGDHPDSIRPAKGIHITVPAEKLPCDIAAVVPVPKDRRSIFVVPWGSHTYLGTTDTDYQGDLEHPECTAADVQYVLDAINLFVTSPLTPDDVTGTWAGLRPLVKNEGSARTADLSRRHKVLVSDSGLVTIQGGKLTTYRKMAEDTIDEVVKRLGRHGRHGRSTTAKLELRGADDFERLRRGHDRLGFDDATYEHLLGRYGSDIVAIAALVEADPTLGRPLVPRLPYLRAEALYAARHEMAHTLEDILSRRTRALLLERDGADAVAPDVAALVAVELGWDADEQARQVEAFRAIAAKERDAARTFPAAEDLPEAAGRA